MKKMMLMAAVMGLVGTAGAAGSYTAPVVFTANVTTVCRVVSAQLPTAPTAINYTAANTTDLSTTASLPSGMSLECTKGTALTIKATTAGEAPTSVASYNLPTPDAAMSLTLGTNKLNGKYSLTVNKVASPDQMTGDKYTGSVIYKATAGQWGAPAGTYTGTLNIVVSYQ